MNFIITWITIDLFSKRLKACVCDIYCDRECSLRRQLQTQTSLHILCTFPLYSDDHNWIISSTKRNQSICSCLTRVNSGKNLIGGVQNIDFTTNYHSCNWFCEVRLYLLIEVAKPKFILIMDYCELVADIAETNAIASRNHLTITIFYQVNYSIWTKQII